MFSNLIPNSRRNRKETACSLLFGHFHRRFYIFPIRTGCNGFLMNGSDA